MPRGGRLSRAAKWIALYCAASAADIVSTLLALTRPGVGELNPRVAARLTDPLSLSLLELSSVALVAIATLVALSFGEWATSRWGPEHERAARLWWLVPLAASILRLCAAVHNAVLFATGWESPLALLARSV